MSKARRLQAGTSAASAVTVRETLFARLVVETAKYLDMSRIPFGEAPSGQQKVQRGIIRGMAMAITKMYGNGYEPHWKIETVQCEKRAISLAKEWIDDGKPEGDGWWLRRRVRFWRSRTDASASNA